jgi:hypothetical protein
LICATAILILSGCAGRSAQPVAVTTAVDPEKSCAVLNAEITQNNTKIVALREEEEEKKTQNIVSGTVGAILFFPALFVMDFQDTAGKKREALESRNQYLGVARDAKCKNASPEPTMVKAPVDAQPMAAPAMAGGKNTFASEIERDAYYDAKIENARADADRKSTALAEDCSADDADKASCKQDLITVSRDRRDAIDQIEQDRASAIVAKS